MTRPVVDGPLRERLLPLVERLPVERQGLEARPALLLVEPAPRQEEPRRRNAVVHADVGRDLEGDAVALRCLEAALAGAELADPDVMRCPVLAVDVPLRLQET